jgi:hypothetical protein
VREAEVTKVEIRVFHDLKKDRANVLESPSYIKFIRGDLHTVFPLRDLISAKLIKGKEKEYEVSIHLMPYQLETTMSGSTKVTPYRYPISFKYLAPKSVAFNIAGTLDDLVSFKTPKKDYLFFDPKPRNYLVLINPFACAGKAIVNWTYMKPILS